MIIVVAALKGGVGKTTTSVYLAALAAAAKRETTLVDSDPQASAADWVESSGGSQLEAITLVEAPTERLLAKAIDAADCVVVPTRVGGVETTRVEAVLAMVPINVPLGLVVCSARTFTRDYQDVVASWTEAKVEVWGTVPERVAIASGPDGPLSADGLDAYRPVWRRATRAVRE